MIKIYFKYPNEEYREKEFQENTTALKILKEDNKAQYPLIACRINQEFEALTTTLKNNDKVEFLNISDPDAGMSYQASLSFLYISAVKDIEGKATKVTIANTLSRGLLTQIRKNGINAKHINAIANRMQQLIKEDIKINTILMSRDDLLAYAQRENRLELKELLESAIDLREGYLAMLGDYEEIFFTPLLPSTSFLNNFELKRYKSGILLRFPTAASLKIPPYKEEKLIYEAFSEATRFDKIVGIDYIAELNNKTNSEDFTKLVLLSEALHEKKIAQIADKIIKAHKKIILIAGPSSSGKTTFAKRLMIQMQVNGLKPLYLGTDDYFFNAQDTPLGIDGKPDFESIRAVDVKLFTKQMNALLNGEAVYLPRFDFKLHQRIFSDKEIVLANYQPIIIEGIHGLNPELTENIADNAKFKIYISPLTQVNIDAYNRIPATDLRFLRRLIRDERTRAHSASRTLELWPNVRKGEEINIFPYTDEADVFFNSACIYEPLILKNKALKLLEEVGKNDPHYSESQRIINLLRFFNKAEGDSCIPNNSILREFIGGSVFD